MLWRPPGPLELGAWAPQSVAALYMAAKESEWVLRHNPTYLGRPFVIHGQPVGAHPCDLTVVGPIYGTNEDQFACGTTLRLYQMVQQVEGRPPAYMPDPVSPVLLQRIVSGRWMPEVGGTVYVFWPSRGGFPPGYYRTTVMEHRWSPGVQNCDV